MLAVEHITQPAVLVTDLDAAMDWLHIVFGIYPSERVDIKNAGVNNAVYTFDNRTYLELIEPYDPDSSAYRLLQRSGPGWHMLNVDICHDDYSSIDKAIRATGIRIVQTNRTDHVAAAWHLHPRDTHGVLLNLADPVDHDEHGMWAGWAWREYVKTNTRVVDRILGVSVVAENLYDTRKIWEALGLRFENMWVEYQDDVIEAQLATGTFLQIRQPRSTSSPSQAALDQHGPGLHHLCWGVRDLSVAHKAMTTVGVNIDRNSASGFWPNGNDTVIAVPMEFRKLS